MQQVEECVYIIVYIFLIRMTSRVDLATSICLSDRPFARMNAVISETIKARKLEPDYRFNKLMKLSDL